MQADAQTDERANVIRVTAAEYCDFLNRVAASDPDHLYDEKMTTDPEAACIIRGGAPGKYFYQVIAGRGNFSLAYVNGVDESSYCNKTDNIIFDDDKNSDALLKSNLIFSQVAVLGMATMTLAEAAVSKESSHSYWNNAIAVLGFIGLIASSEMMMRKSNNRVAPAVERPIERAVDLMSTGARSTHRIVACSDLRSTAASYSKETILFIHEDGAIQPHLGLSATVGRSQSMISIEDFKAVLKQEYPSTIIDEIIDKEFSDVKKKKSSLPGMSCKKLQDFFNQLDKELAVNEFIKCAEYDHSEDVSKTKGMEANALLWAQAAKNAHRSAIYYAKIQRASNQQEANLFRETARFARQSALKIAQAAKIDIYLPSIGELSAKELEQFPAASLIQRFIEHRHNVTTENSVSVRILKTMLKHPYIRIQDEVDAAGVLVNQEQMIADHIVLTFKQVSNRTVFLHQLKSRLPSGLWTNTWLEESIPSLKKINRLHIKPNFLEQFSLILKTSQELGESLGVISSPNFISSRLYCDDPRYSEQWNLHEESGIKAPLPLRPRGEAIPIAVVDTGLILLVTNLIILYQLLLQEEMANWQIVLCWPLIMELIPFM